VALSRISCSSLLLSPQMGELRDICGDRSSKLLRRSQLGHIGRCVRQAPFLSRSCRLVLSRIAALSPWSETFSRRHLQFVRNKPRFPWIALSCRKSTLRFRSTTLSAPEDRYLEGVKLEFSEVNDKLSQITLIRRSIGLSGASQRPLLADNGISSEIRLTSRR
jgi:hypothetical protein